jgi:hypothetical protein
MATQSQPAPGLNVQIAMEQVGMDIVLNLQFPEGAIVALLRMSMPGAEALETALKMALEKAKTTIIKPPGRIIEN